MLKVCLIGASGHWNYAANGVTGDNAAVLSGIAPGSKGEDIGPAYEMLCRNGNSPARYEDFIRMLDEQKPDIAVVNCYFNDHARVGIEALKRGCHLFVEKPLATTLEDLENFRRAYGKSGRHLAGMFALRYSPGFDCLERHKARNDRRSPASECAKIIQAWHQG